MEDLGKTIIRQSKELHLLQHRNAADQHFLLVRKKIAANQVRHLNELSVWSASSRNNNNHNEWKERSVVFRNLQDQVEEAVKAAVDLAVARAAADPEGVKQSERVVNWPPFLI